MAQRTCAGTQDVPLRSEAAWLRRRRELEDMPTTRIGARDEEDRSQEAGLNALCSLLTEQNRLLCDILGATTSLTAAQLASGQLRRG